LSCPLSNPILAGGQRKRPRANLSLMQTTVTVTVTLKGDGGSAKGGQDTSASQQFTITVNP